MWRWLYAFGFIICLTANAWCSCVGPYCWDDAGASINAATALNGSVAAYSGLALGPTSVNASYSALATDTVILASGTPSGITITLPSANAKRGQTLQVTKVDTSTQTVTIKVKGNDLIGGTTGLLTLNAIGQTDELVSDGVSSWWPHGQGIQPTPRFIGDGSVSGTAVGNSSAVYAVANDVRVPISVLGVRMRTFTSGCNVSVGVYDANWTLLASSNSVPDNSNSTSVTYPFSPPLNLSPGLYYVVMVANNGTCNMASTGSSTTGAGCYIAVTLSGTITLPSSISAAGVATNGRCVNIQMMVAGGTSQ